MKLHYNRQLKKSVVTLEIETTGFTAEENSALDSLGEPVIHFEKQYTGGFSVSIDKKIRTGFKVKVKFDGSKDGKRAQAVAAATQFFEDIQELLSKTMGELMDAKDSIEFDTGSQAVDIEY